jgi:hypothetical protein
MAIPRYEREAQQVAGRRFTRAVLKAFGVAALIGLVAGLLWVVAGLVNFHVLQ